MGWLAWVASGYGALLASSALLGAALCRTAARSAAQDGHREVLLWGSGLPDGTLPRGQIARRRARSCTVER